MKLSLRRAETLALVALSLQVLFFLLTLWIAASVGSLAVKVEAWHFLGGVGLWMILLLQFRQRRLAQEEHLDAEQFQQLRSQGKDTSVFEATAVESSLHLAQRRLAWLEKYLLAIFALLIASYLLAMGYWLFRMLNTAPASVLAAHETRLGSAAYLAALALVSFLFSRYAVGMSQQAEWRPLRAGGSYLLSNALACFALAIILLIADIGYPRPEQVMAYVLVVLMLAIGVEILFNLVLDAYRPRIQGRYRRAAYESRLLGLFSEPGGLLRTAAHAIDYQFGFKVSETWFYRLLERAVVPLLVLQALVLYFMSCLAIVEPGSVAVLERFGQPLNINHPYKSGIHLKFPWPIDKIRAFPLEQLQIIEVGFERGEDQHDDKPVLWTAQHWKREFPFMVAVADTTRYLSSSHSAGNEQSPSTQSAVPDRQDTSLSADSTQTTVLRNDFDLLVMGLIVHYRISNIAQYGYGRRFCYQNPHELLESLCYREVVQYAARSNIEKLLGPGRHKTMQALSQAIQVQADQHQLGVKIVFVGLESVHPPVEVAESFEKVVAALQKKQAKVLNAEGKARQELALADGESAVRQADAEAYAFRRSRLAQAVADRFTQQLDAYNKGRQVYQWREYLAVLDELLPALRKYVIASSNVNRWVYEVELKEKLQPDLFEGLGLPEPKQENEK